MNDNDLHTQVSRLSDAKVALPGHEERLRALLLERYTPQQAVQRNFSMSTFITHIREGTTVKKFKIVGVSGGLMALALVAVITIASLTPPTSVSAAQQIAKTKVQVHEMSPEEVARLSEKFNQNLNQRLAEAQNAKDVRYLSAEQFKETTGINPADKLSSVKSYVAFTAADGSQVIIAVDNSDRPVILLAKTKAGFWDAPGLESAPQSVR